MAKKKEKIDVMEYMTAIYERQELEKAIQYMEGLDGRGLYNMESISLCAKYLINRPSNHGLHGTVTNYPMDPVETVQDILVDGIVYYKVDDYQNVHRENYVRKVDVNISTGLISFILIGYAYGEKGDMYYWESYSQFMVAPPTYSDEIPVGGAWYTVYAATTKDDEETMKHLVPVRSEWVPFLPYVFAKWKGGVSFLDDVKETIIRIESASRVIGVENVERRGSSLYISGVSSVTKIRKAPKQYGRTVYMLEEGAEFHNPGSDVAGFELLKWEINNLWNALEKATNVVSTEKLASLSGISRLIAEKPLIFLCEDLRIIYQKLLFDIYALVQPFQPNTPEPQIRFRRLVEIEDKVMYLTLLDKGLEKKAITDKEYGEGLRLLLDLV